MAGDDDKNKDSKVKRQRADPSVSNDDDSGDSTSAAAPERKKAKISSSQDEKRRKEVREINRLAARESRARKKRLMSDLKQSVSDLTAEHSALMRQNRELTIRLETLRRCRGVIPPTVSTSSAVAPGTSGVNSGLSAILGMQGMAGIPATGQPSLLLSGPTGAQLGLLAGLQVSPGLQPQGNHPGVPPSQSSLPLDLNVPQQRQESVANSEKKIDSSSSISAGDAPVLNRKKEKREDLPPSDDAPTGP